MSITVTFLALMVTVLATVIPSDFVMAPNVGGMQAVPQTAKAPGTFSNGDAPLLGEPPDTANEVPDVYSARDFDIPIGRYMNGNLNFFPTVNDPTSNTSVWGSDHDDAEQTACGIPANAYFISNVAIHPYWLKYAPLDRYCMQDICIWFWKEDGSSDMLLKVTDICTPDSEDGVPCMDPMDIKIDRTKAGIIMSELQSVPEGNQYPDKVWWLFTKCSFDGLVQPAYQNNSNWFSDPFLPNNIHWVEDTATTQYLNNQQSYPAKGWETYPPGLYNISRYAQPISDYVLEEVPSWSPIAGGKGSSLKTSRVWSPPGSPAASSAQPSASSQSATTLPTIPPGTQSSMNVKSMTSQIVAVSYVQSLQSSTNTTVQALPTTSSYFSSSVTTSVAQISTAAFPSASTFTLTIFSCSTDSSQPSVAISASSPMTRSIAPTTVLIPVTVIPSGYLPSVTTSAKNGTVSTMSAPPIFTGAAATVSLAFVAARLAAVGAITALLL